MSPVFSVCPQPIADTMNVCHNCCQAANCMSGMSEAS